MISGRKKHIKKSLKYLTPLSKLPTHKSTSITHLLSDQAIHAICESCHNLITNVSSEQTGKGVFSLIASVVIPALIATLSK